MDLTTWDAMVLQEPALKRLEEDVRKYALATCTDEGEREIVWVRAFKPRVKMLVGWDARYACLQSERSYMTATGYLYELLMTPSEATR